jgi:hypothetical protein
MLDYFVPEDDETTDTAAHKIRQLVKEHIDTKITSPSLEKKYIQW